MARKSAQTSIYSEELQRCLQACETCHRSCIETIQYCLAKGGAHSAPDHIRLLLDCAQFCHLTADLIMRQSPRNARMAALCMEVCRRCAEDCQRLPDEQMLACAKACRECADMCRSIIATE